MADEYAQNSKVVVIINEAQDLNAELFETIRFLTNLETEKKKLIQIILVGQLELDARLRNPELKALDQRVALRHRLLPFSKEETEQYIYHRLNTAGAREIEFTSAALRKIYSFSRGTPRLINIACDKALAAGCLAEQNKIDGKIVAKALQDTQRRYSPSAKPLSLSSLPWGPGGR